MLGRHLLPVIDSYTATSVIGRLSQTLDLVNQPCGNGHPCGLLANMNKTVTKVGDAIVTTQLTERNTTPHVVAAMDAFNTSAVRLSVAADALAGTAQQTTATIATAQPLLVSLNATAQASTSAVKTVDKRLSDPLVDSLVRNLEATSEHVASTSAHVDATTGDLQKVADKATGGYLSPKPWWEKLPGYANDAVRAACLVTGRCP